MKLTTIVSYISFLGLVPTSQQHAVWAGEDNTHDEIFYGDAQPTGPKGLRLFPGDFAFKGTLSAANDRVDCYQYYSDDTTSGFVYFHQKPPNTKLVITGKATVEPSTDSSCTIRVADDYDEVIPDCQAVTFLKGTSYFCVKYSGTDQTTQNYELGVHPPSGSLVILNEQIALGSDKDNDVQIPTGVNTIVGTIGGYIGNGSSRKQDLKDCYVYAVDNPGIYSAVVFRKQPPGATLKFYSWDNTPLNSTTNTGHCSENDYFDAITTIPSDTLCASVKFDVMSLICVELESFAKKQQYELYLSRPGTYFDFTPY